MRHDTITRRGLSFAVSHEPDTDTGEPWKECDGHGPVSDWTRRKKQPGERVLHVDHGLALLYDFAAAVRLARAEGWGPIVPGDTPGSRAARAVNADFEFLRGYCVGEWSYIGVVVELLDVDGNGTGERASLWGVESCSGDYLQSVAAELAGELARTIGRRKYLRRSTPARQEAIRVRA